jgi:NAD(P)-dependent dehydrogenase (short-subunit alcohol dehydrogenase family)
MDLKSKVAVVIGASAGIGRAYALALAGAGATVVAAARTLGDAETRNTLAHTVKMGEGLPGKIHAHVCDALLESGIARTMEDTIARFGRIDVLVNDAALMSQFDPFQVTAADWDRMMHTNARGPYFAIKHAAPHMMRQRSGSIINITAKAGQFMPKGNRAHDGTILYALTKAALNRLSFFMSEDFHVGGIEALWHRRERLEPRRGRHRHRAGGDAEPEELRRQRPNA